MCFSNVYKLTIKLSKKKKRQAIAERAEQNGRSLSGEKVIDANDDSVDESDESNFDTGTSDIM